MAYNAGALTRFSAALQASVPPLIMFLKSQQHSKNFEKNACRTATVVLLACAGPTKWQRHHLVQQQQRQCHPATTALPLAHPTSHCLQQAEPSCRKLQPAEHNSHCLQPAEPCSCTLQLPPAAG
eukprot:363764-Chlamydomonas_euryale.AAC.11